MRKIYTVDIFHSTGYGDGMITIMVETEDSGVFDRDASLRVIKSAIAEYEKNERFGSITNVRINRTEATLLVVMP